MPTLRQEEKQARTIELREDIRKMLPEAQSGEFKWLMTLVLRDQLRAGETRADMMTRIWRSRYVRIPVSVREFVTGKPYLNLPVGQNGAYPEIMEALERLFDGPYSEVVLAGSMGWGKCTFGALAVCYDLYRLSCLKDPATTYGMKTGSNITFVNVSVDKRQAERAFFTDLRNMIKSSWYFNHVFKYDKSSKTEIRFPNNIHFYPVAASERAILGVNVFGAFIDQVNRMHVMERSKRATPGGGTIYNQAEVLFNKLRARIRSRMNLDGRVAGHLYASSSARCPFTERIIREARRESAANEKLNPELRRGPSTLILTPSGVFRTGSPA